MTTIARPRVRCAIYTRKSSEEGLEQSFNSLQAQREAYIASQRHEGWQVLPKKLPEDSESRTDIRSRMGRRLAPNAAFSTAAPYYLQVHRHLSWVEELLRH